MARRQSTPLDDFFEICCVVFRVIPPWTSLPAAVLVFLVPTFLFGRIQLQGLQGSPFMILGMTVGAFAALACLVAGYKGHELRKRQQAFVGEELDVNWAYRLSWREFERQVGEVYRQDGYLVEDCGGRGPDGGVDLRLRRGNELVLVQCKHWKSWQVGVPVVRELYGVMAAEGASRGIVVTSGRFSREAMRFAERKSLELVAGDGLLVLLRRFQRNLATALGKSVSVSPATSTCTNTVASVVLTPTTPPACPKCASGMILRTAKRGANAGGSFWGCPSYPRCSGIRPA